MQTDVDHPSDSGVDILNLANPGDNAFEGNVCLTAVNAPCSSLAPSLTASPNPIPVTGGTIVGQTTLSWNAPDAQEVEIHIGSPGGPLFTQQGNRGSIRTGAWVPDGMTFYLQDVTGGKPLMPDYTLATVVVNLHGGGTNGATPPRFGGPADRWAAGTAAALLALVLVWAGRMPRRRRLPAISGAVLLAAAWFSFLAARVNAQSHPTAQQASATLDRMVAAHKGQQELAQYVFQTQGCETCHTLGQNGKLGFTSKGRQVGADYEGCIRLLTDVSAAAKVPDGRRSEQQRHKAARFQEFGCTFCHQINPDRLGLTAVGAKLSNLHLGCVQVEEQLAARR